MPSYQFSVDTDGIAVSTNGVAFEWNTFSTLFITPLGLMTRGLVVGLGDQWQYSESAGDPGWVVDDI